MGQPVPDLNDYSVYVGPPLLNTLMNLCSMTKEEAENATEIYRGIYNTVGKYKNKLYDGIEKLLTALKNSGAKSQLQPLSTSLLQRML